MVDLHKVNGSFGISLTVSWLLFDGYFLVLGSSFCTYAKFSKTFFTPLNTCAYSENFAYVLYG